MIVQNFNLVVLSVVGVLVWLDDLLWDWLCLGNLQELIDIKSVVGVIINLLIFQKVLLEGYIYDVQIVELVVCGVDVDVIICIVIIDDVCSVCDVLVFQWEDFDGVDGWVLIEVDLWLVYEIEKMI